MKQKLYCNSILTDQIVQKVDFIPLIIIMSKGFKQLSGSLCKRQSQFSILLICIFLFTMLPIPTNAQSPLIILKYNSTYNITMYQSYTTNQLFVLPFSFSCSNFYLFTNNLTSSEPYQLILNSIPQYSQITITSRLGNVNALNNASKCTNQQNCIVQITNQCKNPGSYDLFDVRITNLDTVMSYNVLCNQVAILSPFQYGLVILVVFSILQIIFSAYFQHADSFNNWGHYVNYYSLLAFCLAIVAGQILIFLSIQHSTVVVTNICLAFSVVVSIFSAMACFCQLAYATKIQFFRSQFGLPKFKMRIMEIFGILLGVGVVCAWYFANKNWIISNLIYCLIFLTLIKFIKFGSLKIAFITFVSTALFNITFIILTQTILNKYFNNLILSIFNNPLFLFCPCINYTPNQKCSWLFITCLAYPGFVLCYLKRFDHNHSTKIYSLVFLVCFTVFAIIWLVMSAFVPFTLPFDLITSPICIVVLCLFANRRGELATLWNGQIFDAEHKDKIQQQNQLKTILKQERSETYKSQWFRLKLSNVSSSSVRTVVKGMEEQQNRVKKSEEEVKK